MSVGMEKQDHRDTDHWQLDKHIPISLLAALFFQLIIFIALFATLMERVTVLERDQTSISALPERLASLEAQVSNTNDTLRDIRDDVRAFHLTDVQSSKALRSDLYSYRPIPEQTTPKIHKSDKVTPIPEH